MERGLFNVSVGEARQMGSDIPHETVPHIPENDRCSEDKPKGDPGMCLHRHSCRIWRCVVVYEKV